MKLSRHEYEADANAEDDERTEFLVSDEIGDYQTIKFEELPISPEICPRWPRTEAAIDSIYAHLGVVLTLMAATCFAVNGAFIYVMSQTVNTYQISAMVTLYLLAGSTLLMVVNRVTLPRTVQQWIWTLPSGFLVAGTNYLYTFSCLYMIMSDVTAISQVSVVFMGILSCLVLGDSFNVGHFLLTLLALAGVICIAHPTFIFGSSGSGGEPNSYPEGSILGPLFALGSALCEAPAFIFIRKQGLLGVDTLQSVFVTALTIESLSIVLCTAVGGWKMPTYQEWMCSCGAGVFYMAFYVLLYMALRRETATLVVIVLNFQLIVAFLLQLFLFSEDPQLTSWIGALLVTVACIGTLVRRGE